MAADHRSIVDKWSAFLTEHTERSLGAFIEQAGLGPARVVDITAIPVQVEVDPQHAGKARVLTRWLDHLGSAEPILHRYPRTAPRIRVNIRGLFDGVPLVVYAVYEQAREPEQFALLEDLHGRNGSVELAPLLDALIQHEPEDAEEGGVI